LFINETGAAELYFAGMEATRRDWTALAKDFQVDLFTLLFKKYDSPELQDELCDKGEVRLRRIGYRPPGGTTQDLRSCGSPGLLGRC
jgi:DNA polymerase elongation subunit (family B)